MTHDLTRRHLLRSCNDPEASTSLRVRSLRIPYSCLNSSLNSVDKFNNQHDDTVVSITPEASTGEASCKNRLNSCVHRVDKELIRVDIK